MFALHLPSLCDIMDRARQRKRICLIWCIDTLEGKEEDQEKINEKQNTNWKQRKQTGCHSKRDRDGSNRAVSS